MIVFLFSAMALFATWCEFLHALEQCPKEVEHKNGELNSTSVMLNLSSERVDGTMSGPRFSECAVDQHERNEWNISGNPTLSSRSAQTVLPRPMNPMSQGQAIEDQVVDDSMEAEAHCKNWSQTWSCKLVDEAIEKIEKMLQMEPIDREATMLDDPNLCLATEGTSLPVASSQATHEPQKSEDLSPPGNRLRGSKLASCDSSNIELPDAVNVDFAMLRVRMENSSQQHTGKEVSLSERPGRSGQAFSLTEDHSASNGGLYDLMGDEDVNEGVETSLSDAVHLDLAMLVELLEGAEPTLQYIEGKDVIMLLGTTGVGKSTLIQALDGRQLRQVRYSRESAGKLSTLERDVWVADSELDGFAIGHDQVSKTRGIRHYAKGSVVYVDSSGFEDTAGAEVDISTTLSFMRVAKSCRRLRFVILINCASFLQDRGGSMRSLVSLVLSMVDNFNVTKLAFSFIFTHTDVVPEAASKNVSELKGLLSGHLTEVLHGTRDRQVKRILKWMVGCLDNKFPFVDVFHPKLSNISDLQSGFEKFAPERSPNGQMVYPAIGLTPSESPIDVIRCGLTAKSISKLKNELDRLRMETDDLLRNSLFGKLAEVLRTVTYLMRHTPEIEEVAKAFKQIVEKIQQHQNALKESAFRLIDAGTKRGPHPFGPENARRALEQLAALDALENFTTMATDTPSRDARKDMEFLHRGLRRMVLELHQDFCDDQAQLPQLDSATSVLQKLRVWADVHATWLPHAQAGYQVLENYISRCMWKVKNSPDIASVIQPLAHLAHIYKALPGLTVLDIPGHAVQMLHDNISDKVSTAIRAVSGRALSELDQIGADPGSMGLQLKELKHRLPMFQNFMESLERICEALSSEDELSDLKMTCEHASQSVLKAVVSELQRRCSAAMESIKAEQSANSETLFMSTQVQAVVLVVNALSMTQRYKSNADAQYKAIMDAAKQAVEIWYSELDHRLDTMSRHGLDDARRHTRLLRNLGAFRWLDSCAPRHSKKVSARYFEYKKRYLKEYAITSKSALSLLRSCLDPTRNGDSFSVQSNRLQQLLELLGSFVVLGEVFPELTKAHHYLGMALEDIVSKWGDGQRSVIDAIPASVDQIDDWCAKDADRLLHVSSHLREISLFKHLMENLAMNVTAKLASLRNSSEMVLAEASNYFQKVRVIRAVKDWQHMELASITQALPGLDECIKKIREDILAHADKVRDIIQESIKFNFSEAESLLQDLDMALTLDELLDEGWVRQQIDMLQSMMGLKSTRLSEELQAQVQEGSFQGIHEYLKTLQGKRQELQEIWTAISESVHNQIALAETSARTGENSTMIVRKLREAEEQIGRELNQRELLDIPAEIENIKSRINNVFGRMLSEITSAVQAADVVAIISRCRAVRLYHSRTITLLDRKILAQAVQTLSEADECLKTELKTVQESVAAFIKQIVEVSQISSVDSLPVYVALGKLRRAVANAGHVDEDDLSMISRLNEEELKLRWLVVCRTKSGGIPVYDDVDMKSNELTEHLGCGALIRELEQRDGRVRYELLSGTGPQKGWIGFRFSWIGSLSWRKAYLEKEPSSKAALPPGMTEQELHLAYEDVLRKLSGGIGNLRKTIDEMENEKMYSSAIVDVLVIVKQELDRGLSEYVGDTFKVDEWLRSARRKKEMADEEFAKMLEMPESISQKLVPMLDILDRCVRKDHRSWAVWAAQRLYSARVQQLADVALEVRRESKASLDRNSYEQAGRKALLLAHMSHVKDDRVRTEAQALQSHVKDRLVKFHADLAVALQEDNILEFEMLFSRHHKFIQGLMQAYPDLDLEPLHQSMLSYTKAKADEVQQHLDSFEFVKGKQSIKVMRDLGRVLTGIFAVYSEGLRSSDKWLREIRELSSRHFGGKALADLGQLYALLDLMPNASPEEVKHAFRRKSLEFHPDKLLHQGIHPQNKDEMQQRIREARDKLMDARVREQYNRGLIEPFSSLVNGVPLKIRAKVQDALMKEDYDHVSNALAALRDLYLIADLVVPKLDVDKARAVIYGIIKENVDRYCASIKNHWTARELKKLNDAMMSLEKMDHSFSAYSDVYNTSWYRDITEVVGHEVDKLAGHARRYLHQDNFEEAPQDFALQLIYLGRIFDELPKFRNHAKIKIFTLLNECQEQGNVATLFKLGMLLEQGHVGSIDKQGEVIESDQRIGKIIVNEFRHFKDVVTFVWNEQTAATQKDIDATLREITIHQVVGPSVTTMRVEIQLLKQGFDIYTQAYDEYFHKWRAGSLELDALVKSIVSTAKGLQPCRINFWSQNVRDQVPKLLAGIAAYFTVWKSGDSYKTLLEAGSGHGQKIKLKTGATSNTQTSSSTGGAAVKTENVLQKPHSIQILTILRLLGYDGSSDGHGLRSQLMHIRTGEGKSMILGMSSLLFGLLGFKVRSICYSEYLSLRDYKMFEDMFTKFGVSDLITYSRITTFSEDQTAAKGNIRDLTNSLLRKQQLTSTQATSAISAISSVVNHLLPQWAAHVATNDEILLVDEVDMFFGKDFYGQTHNQVALIDAPEVSDILRYIWRYRSNSRSIFEQVKQTPEYDALLRKFPGWEFIIDNEVSAMCHDLKDFNTPPYHVSHATDSIGYQDMDGISYDIVYGYRTAFAYLNEEANFKDPTKALGEALRLRVPCGQFSYARINFSVILGVSGTVAALGEHEWDIMNKYGIDLYTKMPSVYGLSNFKFLDQHNGEPIRVEKTRDEQFMAITDQVKIKLGEKRAAIVIFESPSVLDAYMKSSYFRQIQRKAILNEKLTHDDKEFIIKKAATSGQATFTSALFGRGTDFFCNDEKLQKTGGVHVIQAFFSMDKSEEVQIQGRTARQGKKGTYSMVLLEGDVHQQLDTNANLGIPPPDLYKFLEEKRRHQQGNKYQSITKQLMAASERDALSHKYFDALLAGDRENAKSLLQKLYEKIKSGPAVNGKGSHIVFCLDESGSMSGSPWQDLMGAFKSFIQTRFAQGRSQDLVSVVQFSHGPRVSMEMKTVAEVHKNPYLSYKGGGTQFRAALQLAQQLLQKSAQMGINPVLIFMSDGANGDGECAQEMAGLHAAFPQLQCYMVFFGQGGSSRLKSMAAAIPNGQYHLSVNGVQLVQTFKTIALGAEFKAARV